MRERGRRPWQHPSAGINRIKFGGCDLSPDPAGHPVSGVRLAKPPDGLRLLLRPVLGPVLRPLLSSRLRPVLGDVPGGVVRRAIPGHGVGVRSQADTVSICGMTW